MDIAPWFPVLIVLAYLVPAAVTLLLLYGITRVAVSRGMRDHQKWLEQTGRASGPAAAGSPAPYGYDPDAPRRF